MKPYQRNEAIELLCVLTDVDPDAIAEHDDVSLGAWMYELGYDWHGDAGTFGAWKPYEPPPTFAPVPVHVECSDFGPLFKEVQ